MGYYACSAGAGAWAAPRSCCAPAGVGQASHHHARRSRTNTIHRCYAIAPAGCLMPLGVVACGGCCSCSWTRAACDDAGACEFSFPLRSSASAEVSSSARAHSLAAAALLASATCSFASSLASVKAIPAEVEQDAGIKATFLFQSWRRIKSVSDDTCGACCEFDQATGQLRHERVADAGLPCGAQRRMAPLTIQNDIAMLNAFTLVPSKAGNQRCRHEWAQTFPQVVLIGKSERPHSVRDTKCVFCASIH